MIDRMTLRLVLIGLSASLFAASAMAAPGATAAPEPDRHCMRCSGSGKDRHCEPMQCPDPVVGIVGGPTSFQPRGTGPVTAADFKPCVVDGKSALCIEDRR